jgi:hypothetical protein
MAALVLLEKKCIPQNRVSKVIALLHKEHALLRKLKLNSKFKTLLCGQND